MYILIPVWSYKSPAIGGPTVSGMEHIPRRKPMACVAPLRPQMSKAIGPSNDMKHPSNSPIASEIARSTRKDLVTGRSIVRMPILRNDI